MTGVQTCALPILKEIGFYVFAGCTSLKSVIIPTYVTTIGDYAFGYIYDENICEYVKSDGFTIIGYIGSAAEFYANENGFKFINLSELSTAIFGDVDGDGKVSIDDATSIQKYLANMGTFNDKQEYLADVDKNGKVSIDDVTLIQKHLAGLATI